MPYKIDASSRRLYTMYTANKMGHESEGNEKYILRSLEREWVSQMDSF